MKEITFILLLISSLCCHSKQERTTSLTNFPSFKFLLIDSTKLLSSSQIKGGNPIVVVYFRPDCIHCQDELKSILSHINSLSKADFYFLSGESFNDLKGFYHYFNLSSYKNIIVGQDYQHSVYDAFKPTSVPYMAIYDSQKRLQKIYKEGVDANMILKAIKI